MSRTIRLRATRLTPGYPKLSFKEKFLKIKKTQFNHILSEKIEKEVIC